MATKRIDFIVSEKGTAKTKAGLKGVDNQLLSMAKSAISVGVAMAAIHKASELTKLAADAVNVEKAFRNLAKEPDRMLVAMKRAVGGTIKEFELMRQFNQAALLGLPLDRFDEMLAIARSSAQATGQSMDFMLNSIVTGIGRQSRLMIDNLGLIVSVGDANETYAKKLGKLSSELTQVEQKTAFANAVLKAGAENIAKMGGAAEGSFDNVQELTSLVRDKTLSVFKDLVPLVDAASEGILAFLDIGSGKSDMEKFEESLKGMSEPMKALHRDLRAAREEFEEFNLTGGAFTMSTAAELKDRINDIQMTILSFFEAETLAHSGLRDLKRGFDDSGSAIALNSIELKNSSAIINDLRTDYEKLGGVALESGLKGLAMSQNLGDASRALAQQYIVEGVFGAVKGALTEVPFPLNLLAAGAAGIAANAIFNNIMPAATGADFNTSGPQLMLVGEAGREHVSVTPLEGPNINGPQGGITIQVMGDFIGNQDFVESNIIPAINLATRQGRAAIA